MKGVEIPDALPEAFVKKHQADLGQRLTLSDPPHTMNSAIADKAQQLATSVVTRIKEHIFPLIGV